MLSSVDGWRMWFAAWSFASSFCWLLLWHFSNAFSFSNLQFIYPAIFFRFTKCMRHFWLCFRTAKSPAHKQHSILTFTDPQYHKLNLKRRRFTKKYISKLNTKSGQSFTRVFAHVAVSIQNWACIRRMIKVLSVSVTMCVWVFSGWNSHQWNFRILWVYF